MREFSVTAAVAPQAPRSPDADPNTAAPETRHSHPVLAFLGRRVAAAILTLVVASFLIFAATEALPGNPATAVLGKGASPQEVRQLDAKLGLDHPFVVRYLDWLGDAVTGNFGNSAAAIAQGETTGASVLGLIKDPLLNSAVLAAMTALLMIPFSLGLGVLAGVRAGRKTDHAVSVIALIFSSMPEFVLGAVLIFVFFSKLRLLPPVALVQPGQSPLANLRQLVLPVLTLLLVTGAWGIRQMRAGVVEVMDRHYVTMARLNGYRERRVIAHYVVRNALAGSVQITAQNLQYLMGGIIVVEEVYSYPGIGKFLVSAVAAHDFREVEAVAVVLAAVYLLINIIADLVVVFLVPKLRTQLA